MLTAGQVAEFRHTGVLALRGFFDAGEVARWRGEIEAHLGHPSTPEDWWSALKTTRLSQFRVSGDPTPHDHAKVRAAFAAVDDVRWSGENEVVIRPPERGPWLGARAPHLDFPIGRPERYVVNTVIYLSHVASRGGAFMYWEGSHHVAWEHFSKVPLDYLARGERAQHDTFRVIHRTLTEPPVEFTGAPGDVLLWHPLLMHSASTNSLSETRIALFGRWGEVIPQGREHYEFTGGTR